LLFSLLLCTHLQFTHLHLVQYKLSSKSSIWQPFLRDSSLLRERFGHRVYVRSEKCRYVVRGGKGKTCDLCGLLEEGKQESRFGQILRLVKCYMIFSVAQRVPRLEAYWMAERLETLPAKQVAWVRFPVPARPTFSVEKWHFSVTLRPGARCKHCNCTV
jgi:hypothetical protein